MNLYNAIICELIKQCIVMPCIGIIIYIYEAELT